MRSDIERHDNPPDEPLPHVQSCYYGWLCGHKQCPVHEAESQGRDMLAEGIIRENYHGDVKACKLFTLPKSRVLSFLFFLAMWGCLAIDGTMGLGMTALRVIGVAVCAWLMVYTNPDIGKKK